MSYVLLNELFESFLKVIVKRRPRLTFETILIKIFNKLSLKKILTKIAIFKNIVLTKIRNLVKIAKKLAIMKLILY